MFLDYFPYQFHGCLAVRGRDGDCRFDNHQHFTGGFADLAEIGLQGIKPTKQTPGSIYVTKFTGYDWLWIRAAQGPEGLVAT